MSFNHTSTLRCYRCHSLSHLARDCTNKVVPPLKEDVVDSGAIRVTWWPCWSNEWTDSAVTFVARLPWRLSYRWRCQSGPYLRLKCCEVSNVWRSCKVRYEFRVVHPRTGDVLDSTSPAVAVFDLSTPCIPVEGKKMKDVPCGFAVIEVHFDVLGVTGFDVPRSMNFREPTTTNEDSVVFIIDGQRVCVSKSILAVHSDVFREMFQNGDKQDAAKEIPLKDVVVEEFVELMRVVHPEKKQIDPQNIQLLMRLADKFEMTTVLSMCELYLCGNKEIDTADKLVAVSKYSFKELHSEVLGFLESAKDIKKVYGRKNEFSDRVKASLLDKMVEHCSC